MKKKIICFLVSIFVFGGFNCANAMKCDFSKYKEQSQKLLENNDFKAHIELTTACISIHPELENLYNNRANSYKRVNDYDSALKDYAKALEINENYFMPYIGRANLWLELDKKDEALKDLNKAIALNPKYPAAFNSRGMLKMKLKDFDGAISDFETAKKLGWDNEIISYNLKAAKYAKENPSEIKNVSVDYGKASSRDIEKQPLTYEEKLKMINDAMYLHGFISANVGSVENFCKNTNYMPNEYISLFKNTFAQTIKYMESLFAQISPEINKKLDITKQARQKEYNLIQAKTYEDINKKFKKEEKIELPKEYYCKFFDENAQEFVDAKIKDLKASEPDLFMD